MLWYIGHILENNVEMLSSLHVVYLLHTTYCFENLFGRILVPEKNTQHVEKQASIVLL